MAAPIRLRRALIANCGEIAIRIAVHRAELDEHLGDRSSAHRQRRLAAAELRRMDALRAADRVEAQLRT